ncbi:NAD(P)-dependent oxidoreductase [Candidatus Caldatribacterium saccharofermentans]|uniref:Hydroxyacid dehydrogenase n=1 Tax=Candidatus Caldatribacterium saccharofermentans TaxID=1454753 RepID=A0A7V4WJQ8_9BACT
MAETIRILCAHGVPEDMVKRLSEEIGPVEVLSSHDEEEILQAIQDKDVFVVRSKPQVTARIIENAPRLKVVARPGVGTDNIDKRACEARGIQVINTPEASASSVAELTVGLAIALLRHLYLTCAFLKEGKWAKGQYTGKTIEGKTWGVVGFGSIGRRVAEIVKAMRAEVLAYDPYVPEEEFTRRGVKRAFRLEELLERSDIVSLHVVLNSETTGLFSEEMLRKMKKGAYLINTSRGKVIDQKALLQVLREGHLAGVALDVYETEPPQDLELLTHENVICTPHIGGSTEEAFLNATEVLVNKLKALFRLGEGVPIGY